jgi:hypothetical protein
VVVNLGHARKELAEAVSEQILHGYYAHPTMFTTPVVEEFASALAVHAPLGVERFYFMTSGSEAVETAIKLARQIQLARKESGRFRLIARWKSYHGLSMGALSAMGRTSFRTPFAPMLTQVEHVPPPYCLRCSFGLKYPECNLRCARFLEETILNLGPETVSAFLGETVSGATLASCPPPPEYWRIVRDICDKYGVLLINDEVMVGMGRTGRWFAGEHYGVIPDLVTLGKGISGGCVPLSAVGVQKEHFDLLRKSTGFVHGGTFSHHPVSCAAGLTALRILERENLIGRAEKMGALLGEKLRKRFTDHPKVAEVRGIGMLWGVELVQDKAACLAYPREEKVTERIWEELFQKGIILYKSMGMAGKDGDGLVISPPFIIEEEDLDFVVRSLAQAIDKVLG